MRRHFQVLSWEFIRRLGCRSLGMRSSWMMTIFNICNSICWIGKCVCMCVCIVYACLICVCMYINIYIHLFMYCLKYININKLILYIYAHYHIYMHIIIYIYIINPSTKIVGAWGARKAGRDNNDHAHHSNDGFGNLFTPVPRIPLIHGFNAYV